MAQLGASMGSVYLGLPDGFGDSILISILVKYTVPGTHDIRFELRLRGVDRTFQAARGTDAISQGRTFGRFINQTRDTILGFPLSLAGLRLEL